jgi:hypothetical protein
LSALCDCLPIFRSYRNLRTRHVVVSRDLSAKRGASLFLRNKRRLPDLLCALAVRVPGYRSRGPDFLRSSGLERGSPSLMSAIEELLERKISGSGLESREYRRMDTSLWPRDFLYPQKLVLTSLTSGGRSVGIVRSLTQATEFSLVSIFR